MPDQADGLRELVMAKGGASDAASYPAIRDKYGVISLHGQRAKELLESLILDDDGTTHDATPSINPTPDKAKLWDELKVELEMQGRGKRVAKWGQSFEDTQESVAALRMLERMHQAETFARVRHDLGGDR